GNLANPAAGAQTNYCLIAKPKSATPAQYVLNTSTSGNGSLMKAPDLPSYAAGALVTLTAVPGANQRFSGWTGAITGIVNPVTVIMDGNKTIQAAFEPVPADYTLAVNITGDGAVSKNPDQLSYVSGTSVTLTATPAAGQQFSGWSGDLTGVSNPVSVLIDGNKTIQALFQPVISNYSLSVNISGSGLVMKNPDQPSYTSGTTVTLTAYPNAGQLFSGWSGDASGSANPISIILNSNKNITAAFQLLPPLISGISSKTGRTYTASILKTGAQVYTDRNYQAATLPAFLNNAPFIESPNDDRNNSSKSVFSFDLGQQTTVYVAYDSKAGTLPSWLKGWQLVQGQQILLNDPSSSKLNLYQAVFSPGKLTFGGNLAKPAKGAQVNYFVIIADPSIQNTSTTLTATRNTLFANEIANGVERLDLKAPFLKIYPNPVVNGTLNIIANEYLPNENVSLKLFDITGKLIFVEFVRADFYGSIRKTLVLKRLVKGMFILQLAGESAIVRKKFLFE
ncbi:MAG: T9SS type A sorting domain-containing protein, partial [Ginsengibacter sp.]